MRPRPPRRRALTTAIACAIALASSAEARAAERREGSSRGEPPRAAVRAAHATLPGFIDGSSFAELAAPEGQLVEVSLRGRLLKLLTSRAVLRHDQELAEVLGGLECLHAVIAEVGAKREVALDRVRATVSRLEEEGWERFVRVREGDGTDLAAFMHLRGEEIVDGLVVVGLADKQIIFVNIAGTIDMERIATLGGHLGLPGLQDLPPRSQVEAEDDGGAAPGGDGTDEGVATREGAKETAGKDGAGSDGAAGEGGAAGTETATAPEDAALAGAPKKESRP